ncbi:MAG: hypothetical protein ABWW69_00925 [Pyrodictiaceae archaeon]
MRGHNIAHATPSSPLRKRDNYHDIGLAFFEKQPGSEQPPCMVDKYLKKPRYQVMGSAP